MWIARIHGPDRSAALEKGLRQWLGEDPLHSAEFELATDVWNESGGTPRGPLPGFGTERREAVHNRLLRPVLAAAVVAGLLIVAWVAYLPGGRAISTEKGEQRTVVLTDGSRITLNADSRVDVNFDRSVRTVVLRYGEAYFDVIHNGAQPFVVRAGDRQVVDLGTRFLVSRYGANDESVSVTVIEGRVAVAPLTDIHLTPSLP
ncbi:MAG: FecR family protein, partial [Candidatus Acidiferrales bacterium]